MLRPAAAWRLCLPAFVAVSAGRAAAQGRAPTGAAANAESGPASPARDAANSVCRRIESRTNLAELSGRTISSIDVTTGGPRSSRLPWLARLSSRAHVRTQQTTLRRFILVAPTDTVDTLRVAESLRRLRRLSYLDDVLLVGSDCGASTPVALTLVARDAMSFRPDVRFNSATPVNGATGTATASPSSYSVGFSERNLLGTGRDVRAAAVGAERRNGFVLAAGDPTVLGSLYGVRARLARNPLENATAFSVRPPDRELAEEWRGEFFVASTRRAGAAARGASFARAGGQGLLARRITTDNGIGAATFLVAGAEAERTRLLAGPNAILGGPSSVRRDFAGIDVGAGRYAEQYRAVSWLLPDARVVDVPRGIEGELIVGLGRDRALGRSTSHMDLWSGRMWLPSAGTLAVADVWGSGYVHPGATVMGSAVSGGSARASLAGVARQRGGYFYTRIAAERLLAPDPDQQALLGFDPTVRMVPTRTRLANTAVAALVERDWRVVSRLARINVDLAGFGAASYRTSERMPSRDGNDDVNDFSTAVGAGIHAVPNALGRPALRLDFVIPVTHAVGGRSNPYLAASVTPWILFDRYRDGRRGR